MIDFIKANLYWVLMSTGAVGAVLLVLKRRKRFVLSVFRSLLFSVFAICIVFLGAKLLFILQNMEKFLADGLTLGGVSLFGAVFLIPVLIPFAGRVCGLCPGQATDICGPCAVVVLGIARIGCYLSGCCGGYYVQIGNISFRWPTQIVESIAAFAILGLLLQMEEDGGYEGALYPIFMIAYGGVRFVVEFFRDTQKPWLGLGHGQWFGLAAILIGILWIRCVEVKQHENKKE